MKCTIKVAMDNAAFECPGELPRILRKVASQIEDNMSAPDKGRCVDFNGNVVGEWKIVKR